MFGSLGPLVIDVPGHSHYMELKATPSNYEDPKRGETFLVLAYKISSTTKIAAQKVSITFITT